MKYFFPLVFTVRSTYFTPVSPTTVRKNRRKCKGVKESPEKTENIDKEETKEKEQGEDKKVEMERSYS